MSDSKGKSWKLQIEDESIVGKSVGDTVDGSLIKPELDGYEFVITGGSDMAGFPLYDKAEGLGLKRVLLKKGWGNRDNREGVRMKKTVRGKQISTTTSQINLKVTKVGSKKMEEIFPDQNKAAEVAPKAAPAPAA